MNEAQFVARRDADWRLLAALCEEASASVGALPRERFHDFVRVYRRVSGDLAATRTQNANPELVNYLNDLVARAYCLLYRSPRTRLVQAIGFAIGEVARVGRRRRWFVLIAVAGMLASGVFGYVVLDAVPASRSVLVAPMQALIDGWVAGIPDRTAGESAMMTGFYASNNPLAAIETVGLTGLSFGAGAVVVLYQNGVMIGVLAHEMAHAGKFWLLVAYLAPHGVTELSGLFLACSAGLVLGWALVSPGRRSRPEALALAGKDAIVLATASVCMMFLAAPIEGWFSFDGRVPWQAKVGFATLEAAAWAAFWTYAGRRPDPSRG